MALVQRQINATFQLSSGTFAESGTNSVTITGLRSSVRVTNAGGFNMAAMQAQFYGVKLSTMNRVATLGVEIQKVPRNTITVQAGDAIAGMSTVFVGNITNAFPDLSQMPNVGLQIEAHATGADAVAPTQPVSYSGSTDAAQTLQKIAAQMNGGTGFPFTNYGVNVRLFSPYLYGPLRQQFLQVVQAGNIGWNNAEDGTIAIWPNNGANGLAPVVVSANTGMIGSPSFTPYGIMVKTIFNPALKLGSVVSVFSQVVKVPQGSWKVYNVAHSLDAQVPRGEWFSTFWATNPNAVQMVPS